MTDVEILCCVTFDKTSTPNDVALQLRGPQGSRVGVTVLRNGETKDFIIQREPIKVRVFEHS
jgi:C-terminal processing protease CtpA/Prc